MTRLAETTATGRIPRAPESGSAAAGPEDLGFEPGDGAGEYRRGDLFLAVRDGWNVLTRTRASVPEGSTWKHREDPQPLDRPQPFGCPDLIGHPGLWRRVPAATSPEGGGKETFEIPAVLISDAPGATAEEIAGMEFNTHASDLSWLAWALTSLEGEVSPGWRCPDRASLESWLSRAELTARSGSILRQGSVLRSDRRLAVRFPLLAEGQGLPGGPRAAWMRAVWTDARRHWRMVRIGLPADPSCAMPLAEIDLSGAPYDLLPGLVRTSARALRIVVERLAPAMALLAGGKIACRALEVSPPRD